MRRRTGAFRREVEFAKRNAASGRLSTGDTVPDVGTGRATILDRARIALTAKEFALTGTEIRTGDAELLEGLQAGSLPAFERLYEEHGDG